MYRKPTILLQTCTQPFCYILSHESRDKIPRVTPKIRIRFFVPCFLGVNRISLLGVEQLIDVLFCKINNEHILLYELGGDHFVTFDKFR